MGVYKIMAINFQEYTASNPNIAFGSDSIQFINGSWTSELNNSLGSISIYGPRSVDNSIENGNVYLANLSSDKVMKLDGDGGLISQIDILQPILISAINLRAAKNRFLDDGAWVLGSHGTLSKISKEMEITATVNGFTGTSYLAADTNGNCAIANDDIASIFLIGSDGTTLSSIDYASFSGVISGSNSIISIVFDSNSDLFVLTNTYLYKVEVSPSYAMTVKSFYNFSSILSSYGGYSLSDMDIDLMPDKFVENESSSSFSEEKEYHQDIYVACGDYTNILLMVFDNLCILRLQKQYSGQAYPYILRLGRGKFSDSIGILTNEKKFNEPSEPWESSSTSSSESSIAPTEIFAGSRNTTMLSKIDTSDFSINFYGNHIVLGSRAMEYNQTNNRVYYVSEYTDEIYYYDLATRMNTLVLATPSINLDRLTISPDKTKLWLSKDSVMYVCDMAGALQNTMNIKLNSLASIESYGGMALHPTNGGLYIASGQAIYRCNANDVNGVDSTLYVVKIANKPSISNNITDICFAESGEMFITDDNSSASRLFKVNYEEQIITYDLVKTYDVLIDAMGSGTG